MQKELKWDHYNISIDSNTKTKRISSRKEKILGLEFFRSDLEEIQDLKLLQHGGIYLLINVDFSSKTKYQMYIGECSSLMKRIKQHNSNKTFWNRGLIFTKDDDTLDRGENRYLETKLFEFLNELDRFQFVNKIDPSEVTKDSIKREICDGYLESIEVILHLFNYIEPADFEDTESKTNQNENYVEIQLGASKSGKTPRWKRYNLIPLNAEIRKFFPKYKEDFIFETDIGEISTYVTSRSGKSDYDLEVEGKYITKGLFEWFREHEELEPGDFLIIKELIPKKRYHLSCRKNK